MRVTNEQESTIFGLFAEGLQDPVDIYMVMMGEVSIAQISELLKWFREMSDRQFQQINSYVTLPGSYFPPAAGHFARDTHSGPIPGCDGQNGPDPSRAGDHDLYGADES